MWSLLVPLALLPWTLALDYSVQKPKLDTEWTYTVGENPWPEYPRPQMVRDKWQNLNGIWSYRAAKSLDAINNPPTGELDSAVMVPSCLESGLSGLMVPVGEALYSWYRTTFEVPSDWNGDNVLINFGAVDYEATVFVNGKNATFHRGGYNRFSADITQYLKSGEENELVVFVYDPTDSKGIATGKQTLDPTHIFYTPCSGIWQSVFIEPVPKNYIERVDIDANMHGGVNITVHSSADDAGQVQIHLNGDIAASGLGNANQQIIFKVNNPKLWSPSDPNLYNISITLGDDTVTAYTGFRTVEKGLVGGVTRPKLNGEFILAFGPLDQGYWPDGIYTPPNREAMEYDLKYLKSLGFNMLRKHVKVETDLFYRACDELGLLVIQDMPCNVPSIKPSDTEQAEWETELYDMVNLHKSFPSIYTWVIYNEGWAQLDSAPERRIAPVLRSVDPTRLIDATSGWNDHGAGDFSDDHHYPDPQCGAPKTDIPSSPYDPNRIGFQGEFGGIGQNVTIDHLWNDAKAISTIPETYRIQPDVPAWNKDTLNLLSELRDQIEQYSCSGGVWTQTTDVEGEINGLLTYDRRLSRPDKEPWQAAISALYDAAARRSNGNDGTDGDVVPAVPPGLANPDSVDAGDKGGATLSVAAEGSGESATGYASQRAEYGMWGSITTLWVFAGLVI